MKWTRARLIAAAKAAGYTGELSLDAIKAWLNDPNDPKSFAFAEGETIDKAWANNPTKALALVGAEDDAEAEQAPARGGKAARRPNPIEQADAEGQEESDLRPSIPLSPKSWRRITERKSYNRRAQLPMHDPRRAKFDDADLAEGFRAWTRSTLFQKFDYPDKAEDLQIVAKVGVTTTFTLGGALVPAEFVPALVSLKEERGAMRKIVRVGTQARDVATYPRRTSGLTTYVPGEATAITASDPGTDQINVTGFNMKILTRMSSELFADSAISMSDFIAEEIAYAFSDKEDECYLNGDGTSTYYHQTGLRAKLAGLSGTAANIAGLVSNSGINLWSEFTMPHIVDMISRLPVYASKNAKFVCSKPFRWQVFNRLALAQGGVSLTETLGSVQPKFLGYDVVEAQVMPRVDADSTVHCLFGDFDIASKVNMVANGMSIATSDQVYFATDEIAVRGTQRWGMTVHDFGNASATASLRIPGPYVGLASTT